MTVDYCIDRQYSTTASLPQDVYLILDRKIDSTKKKCCVSEVTTFPNIPLLKCMKITDLSPDGCWFALCYALSLSLLWIIVTTGQYSNPQVRQDVSFCIR
jgi:hypothetical protein